MKRVDLIKRIKAAAKANGTTFEFVREGQEHTVFRYGSQNVIIPRHREIVERTAQRILRDLDLR